MEADRHLDYPLSIYPRSEAFYTKGDVVSQMELAKRPAPPRSSTKRSRPAVSHARKSAKKGSKKGVKEEVKGDVKEEKEKEEVKEEKKEEEEIKSLRQTFKRNPEVKEATSVKRDSMDDLLGVKAVDKSSNVVIPDKSHR